MQNIWIIVEKKRNRVEYDITNGVSQNEVDDFIKFVEEFKTVVEKWMFANHPELME